MNWGTIQNILSITLGIFAVVAVFDGYRLRYGNAKIKAYAAEREFGHLKRNQEQMAQGIGEVDRNLDEVRLQLARIEMFLMRLPVRQDNSVE